MAHNKLYFHVSQILDASPDCDTFTLETSLLNKITLNNTVKKKKAVSAHLAQVREANMATSTEQPRPWDQEKRKATRQGRARHEQAGQVRRSTRRTAQEALVRAPREGRCGTKGSA